MNKIRLLICFLSLITPAMVFSSCGSCTNHNCCSSGCSCECECRFLSYTTFAIRPQFQTGTVEYLTAFGDRMQARKGGKGGAVQFALFGSKSTRGRKLATYFAPFCKQQLLVKYNDPDMEADLRAQNFNILIDSEDNFESIVSFCPRISTFGIGISYRQRLQKFDETDPEKRYAWFEISAPLTRIKTTMGLCENILSPPAKAVEILGLDQRFYACMTEAFNQCAWRYGRISPCCLCKWGLADITLKIGKEFVKCDKCLFDAYAGILIPTGNERTACYVFEPIVGHGRHFGVLFGPSIIFEIWKYPDTNRKFEMTLDINTQYLFSKMELRTFDLKCKPWSRYLELYCSKEQALEAYMMYVQGQTQQAALLSTPGVNVFTQCIKIYPKLSYSANLAVHFSAERFKLECGYNFYAKQSECADLECRWKKGPAIKDAVGAGSTNSLRMINKNFSVGDPIVATAPIQYYDANVITENDIDFNSAAHLGFISHTLYLSMGGRWDNRKFPPFVNAGVSYEFGCENMILDRWTIWAKAGFSF